MDLKLIIPHEFHDHGATGGGELAKISANNIFETSIVDDVRQSHNFWDSVFAIKKVPGASKSSIL